MAREVVKPAAHASSATPEVSSGTGAATAVESATMAQVVGPF